MTEKAWRMPRCDVWCGPSKKNEREVGPNSILYGAICWRHAHSGIDQQYESSQVIGGEPKSITVVVG